MVVGGDDGTANKIRWLTRLSAARLRSGSAGRQMASAMAPAMEALSLIGMTLPVDAEAAAKSTALLLRGGQVTLPAPRVSSKPKIEAAGKARFKRLARKATQGASVAAPDAKPMQTKVEKFDLHEKTQPQWMVLAELHLLLASAAHAAGKWALADYATVASLRLLEGRGKYTSSEDAIGGSMDADAALSQIGFEGGGLQSLGEGEVYQNEDEAALAARVHSAVAACARRLGVADWAEQHREQASTALSVLAKKTEAAAGCAANTGGRLPRDLTSAEWETHVSLAKSHLACANLDEGLNELIASSRYSHAAGVEEGRTEEALHAASWLQVQKQTSHHHHGRSFGFVAREVSDRSLVRQGFLGEWSGAGARMVRR